MALDDLRERTAVDLAGAAFSHRELAAVRAQGTALVRVFTPTEQSHGWSCGHTVIEIVVEDMPFLVDSVNAELARLGCESQMTIHPQFVVRRDLTGVMHEVLRVEPHLAASRMAGASGQRLPRDAQPESWIHVEVGRETDPERILAMERGLRRVLDDVRVAVEDWPKMRATAARIADGLLEKPPTGPARAEADESAELLRWLAAGHFTFIGYREYDLVERDGEDHLIARTGTGLGVLRHDQVARSARQLTPQARIKAREQSLLVLTKANSRATVHRAGYLDYIGVKTFDDQGRVTGEQRFLGLFASTAYTADVRDVPVIRRKADAVLAAGGFSPDSHSGKDLLEILQAYPRDELFAIHAEMLSWIAMTVMQLQERRRTRLFLRVEDYGRYVSCLVFLPRDRYVTSVRLAIERVLREAIGATTADYTARVTESVLARLHFVVRVQPGAAVPDLDLPALEDQLVKLTRNWDDDFAEAAAQQVGELAGARLVREWGSGIGQGYRVDVEPETAVEDLCRLNSMETAEGRAGSLGVKLYEPAGAAAGEHRFVLYRKEPLSLSAVLPYLTNLGVEVVDERPYVFSSASGRKGYIYDFGLRGARPQATGAPASHDRLHRLFCEAFESAWWGDAESDGFERLVLTAGLDWRQVSVLRGYARYLRQTGSAFGQDYIGNCLVSNPGIAVMLVELFETRFDPRLFGGQEASDSETEGRSAASDALVVRISAALDEVSSLDQDRILRSFLALMQATTRTNRYLMEEDAEPATGIRRALAFKLDPRAVPDLPAPRPAHEIFVYSPWVEGVHLRFGAVARGGLRWSDRREDFRTEILGLVKAQMVKNAVIVPTGAKGGFVAKQLPDPAADRDAWLAEGIACYRSFIGSLLDVTDNRVMENGTQRIVPPPNVFRHDADDSYLVVAADKGTAAFSDLANEVAAGYGFWLGDAFASGGSVGYDHKVMGITARGAWESVDRHFRELGHDVATMKTTVVGVGDMSGDVFGNGMLLSKALQLVAAFDHRHIFLDPDPDPETSYTERSRMFRLARSSWADYDSALISAGGGVYSRNAKSVPITPQVAQRLGIPASKTAMTPNELMKAILTAPVDLLWNGGIGTYVKASTESNADVGDKANDGIRIDGRGLRARVVGEGGNLGLTQLGRVEAALCGVRVNTDAIDNSAGVDCSDHEVNIKILLDGLVTSGRLDVGERTELLASMTDDVARLVLRDNYEQNVLLGNARRQSRGMLPVHQRFIQGLEARGALDRALEYLPDDATLAERKSAELGLTSPEFSVLVAYAKLTLTDDIVDTALPDDPWLDRVLTGYFPPQIGKVYGDSLAAHPLRRQIVTTCLVNDMVNRGGITFAFRCQEETGAEPEQIARAYIVAREVFGFENFVTAVEALDGVLSTHDQSSLYLSFRRLLDRAVRWFIQAVPGTIDIAQEVSRFGPVIAQLAPQIPELVAPQQHAVLAAEIEEWKRRGVPEPLARQAAGLLTRYMLLDIAQIATQVGADPAEVARVYLSLSERYGGQTLLRRISGLPRNDRWKLQARAALRADLYAALETLTITVLTKTGPGKPAERIAEFERVNADRVDRIHATLEEVVRLPSADVAALSVVLRSLRSIV
ncbi:NAD-glutamate dehydrogenase [Kineosporia sp. J2-2]|uniref:NAD-glutamate dehydrogenase n=1 Tax=Kineosporia corallincola TaxID=2835133 RepID=A0ABS5TTJ4_9ACTN|nr:NAD-glutamate dehydrogenase [Kineosporia corallincola]MBT0774118.1 NAD-glutamate dehydrogenase [Kineosporia corallincola]